MNDKVNGLILSLSDYKESDQLMQVLTKDYGVISLVAKAAKKLSSKNHYLPMCLYEFMFDYKQNKTIFTVHGGKLLKSYFEDSDIEMMSFKNILIELTIKNREIDTFDELSFVFDKLDHNNYYLLGSMYVSYIIKRFGIAPVVDSCALCDNKKVVALSNKHGGFICIDHLNGEDVLPVETLKKFRLIIKGDFVNYDVLKQFNYEFRDFRLLLDFYLENSDVVLRSYDFYKSIR